MSKKNLDSKGKSKEHFLLLYNSMVKELEASRGLKIDKMSLLVPFSNLTNINNIKDNPDSVSSPQEKFKIVSLEEQFLYDELDNYTIFISSMREKYEPYITSGDYKKDNDIIIKAECEHKEKLEKYIEEKTKGMQYITAEYKKLCELEKTKKDIKKEIERFKTAMEEFEKNMQHNEPGFHPDITLSPIFLKTFKVQSIFSAENMIITCRKLINERNYKDAMIYALHIASFIMQMQESDLLPAAKTKFFREFRQKAQKIKDASENPKNIKIWKYYKEQKEQYPERSTREIAIKFFKKNKILKTAKYVEKYIQRGKKYSTEISQDPYLKNALIEMDTHLEVYP